MIAANGAKYELEENSSADHSTTRSICCRSCAKCGSLSRIRRIRAELVTVRDLINRGSTQQIYRLICQIRDHRQGREGICFEMLC